jgi:hypothetical protein
VGRVIEMSLAEKVLEEFQKLSDTRKYEVIDFIEYLRLKEEKELDELMDQGIEENMEALKELAK